MCIPNVCLDLSVTHARCAVGFFTARSLSASRAGCSRGPFGGRDLRALACVPPIALGLSFSLQNLKVDTPASTRIIEVLEGPQRPSALFFHTQICTAALPSAWAQLCNIVDLDRVDLLTGLVHANVVRNVEHFTCVQSAERG